MTKKISDGLGVGPVVPESIARSYAAVGPTTLDGMIDAGEFPMFIKVRNRRKWIQSELDAWLEAKKAKRDTPKAKQEVEARNAKRAAWAAKRKPPVAAQPKSAAVKKLQGLKRPTRLPRRSAKG